MERAEQRAQLHHNPESCYPYSMEGQPIEPSPAIQTRLEEKWNCITHGVGVAMSLAGLALMVTLASLHGGARLIVTVSVFGVSLVMMYAVSTWYHACRNDQRKCRLQVLDHTMIYALIAGTYTPFLLVMIGGGWGWSLFGVLWGLALGGVVFKLLLGARFELISTLIYIAMGWAGLIAARPFWDALPAGAMGLILAGGVFYTGGVAFFLWERLPFNHTIWHGFVMAGSGLHLLAVLLYVVPGM